MYQQTIQTDDAFCLTVLAPVCHQDDYDDLCSDFARVCQQQIAARDAIRTCEQDITAEMELLERSKGAERDLHAKKQQEATQQLNAARAQLEKLNAERSRIEKLLEKSAVVGASKPQPESPAAAGGATSSGKPKSDKSGRKSEKLKK